MPCRTVKASPSALFQGTGWPSAGADTVGCPGRATLSAPPLTDRISSGLGTLGARILRRAIQRTITFILPSMG